MEGPGKYDDLCTLVRESTNADGVILIVLGGTKGGGFSVQGRPQLIRALPGILEFTAGEIRKENRMMELDNG